MLRKIIVFLIPSYFCLNPVSFHLPKNEGTLPGIFLGYRGVKNGENLSKLH